MTETGTQVLSTACTNSPNSSSAFYETLIEQFLLERAYQGELRRDIPK